MQKGLRAHQRQAGGAGPLQQEHDPHVVVVLKLPHGPRRCLHNRREEPQLLRIAIRRVRQARQAHCLWHFSVRLCNISLRQSPESRQARAEGTAHALRAPIATFW